MGRDVRLFMDMRQGIFVLTVVVIVMLCVCVGILCFFLKREKKFLNNIQRLLDDAISGKIQEEHYDESKWTMIESQMRRYLCDHEAFNTRLVGEKNDIQTRISDISHQAVIPISNITLYAQLLEEWIAKYELNEKEEIYEALNAIQEQAGTLDFLLESMVKLSRLETGIIHVHVQKQAIQPVLDAVEKQFHMIADSKEIQFEICNTKETAVFDRKWTIEAVSNIVDNAMKYTPFGGKIQIRVEAYSSFVKVDVEDNGIGIAETEQANIFTRFYRSKAVSEKPGVGVGLYLSREVMKAQNGYIKLTSEVGKGSIFSLFFLKEEISQK